MSKKQTASCLDPFEEGAITVASAVEQILAASRLSGGLEKLALRDCLGRCLAEDIISPLAVPAHNNSAMDGYALHSDGLDNDEVKQFRVVGEAYAGSPYHGNVGRSECVRIMTGAILPEQTDSILIQEQVTPVEDNTIETTRAIHPRQNVRFAGEDIQQGAPVLERGHVIKPADLGIIASLGVSECKVFRRPRVSFFSTGDELKSIGETLGAGEIYDSNRYSLFGLLSASGVDIIDMGVVRDDPDSLREALLLAAANSDVVLTSGGVSVGEADYIKDILQQIGDMTLWKILMKPGRPLTFGNIDNALFFGLPGNPVAVMVTFYQFVLPCLKKLAGKPDKPVPGFTAVSLSEIRKNPGRREFQRGIASTDEQGDLQVELTGRQGSGILTSMSKANCFIVLDEDSASIGKGDRVRIEFFAGYWQD